MRVVVGVLLVLMLAWPGQSAQGAVDLPAASAPVASVAVEGDAGSVWVRRGVGGRHEMVQIWRRGDQVRLYSDDGAYPGDGKHCSWGVLRKDRFVGKQQRVAPDPISVRFGLKRKGSRMWTPGFTDGAGGDRRAWRRASLEKYHRLVPESRQSQGTWCLHQHPLPAASSATYWFDREPSTLLGAMVIVTKADLVYAYATYFEGKSCYVGRISPAGVLLNGAHEYASTVRLSETWPLDVNTVRPTTTYGTVGEWRQVARRAFSDPRIPIGRESHVRAVGRLSEVLDIQKKCRWARLTPPRSAGVPAQPVVVPAPTPQPLVSGTPTVPVPSPSTPTATPAPSSPRPASPTPTPTPTAQTSPPPPSATIVVNTCNTYNNCELWNPIWVHATLTQSSRIADVYRGTALTARCWGTGKQLTDGSNQTTEDDARQFTSSLWYGIDWNGGRGFVPAVWTTKREDPLGLPGC